MKVTIIEGPDGAGKTTLTKQAWSGADVVHTGPPSRHGAWRDYYGRLKTLVHNPNEPEHTVFDRFLYGEQVYGPVLRSDTSFTDIHRRMLERVLFSLQGVLVVALPEWEVCREVWGSRAETELVKQEQKLKALYDRWKLLLSQGEIQLPYTTYDFTDPRAVTQVQDVAQMIRPPANQGPGIGRFAEGVTLLVGEQVNTNVAELEWPFVSDQGSSMWLTQQLAHHQVREGDLYWINALDRNGQRTSAAFLDLLRPKQIIAMGRAAEVWCKAHGVQHVYVPHPQAWKRFYSGQLYPLFNHLGYLAQPTNAHHG